MSYNTVGGGQINIIAREKRQILLSACAFLANTFLNLGRHQCHPPPNIPQNYCCSCTMAERSKSWWQIHEQS